jgi:hypothetical protein
MPIHPDLLKELKVRDLGEGHRETLEELLTVLGSDLKLTHSKDLTFLTELWVVEQAKGRKANKKALQQIEDIVFQAFARTRTPKVNTATIHGGEPIQKRTRSRTGQTPFSRIQESEIMNDVEQKKDRKGKAKEIEAKFAVPNVKTFRRLQAIKELAGFKLTKGEIKPDYDIFLDTKNRRIFANGYFCRKRESAGQTVITLKGLGTAERAIYQREEFEAIVPSVGSPITRWPASPLRDKLLSITHAPLRQLFNQHQTRFVRMVTHDQREIAELSLDEIWVDAAGRQLHYLVIEVELKAQGNKNDLTKIATSLRKDFGLKPEPCSKFERGLDFVSSARAS